MSYEPKEWQCGDTITAEDLNRMEQGIAQGGGGSAPLEIHRNDDGNSVVLDKTWQEISDAFPNAFLEYTEDDEDGDAVIKVPLTTVASIHAEGQYQYMVVIESIGGMFHTDSPTGYPSVDR